MRRCFQLPWAFLEDPVLREGKWLNLGFWSVLAGQRATDHGAVFSQRPDIQDGVNRVGSIVHNPQAHPRAFARGRRKGLTVIFDRHNEVPIVACQPD